ncbi:MAG: diguanylate cyclase [Chitinivibrionales bacterium]|nr:diguanylate cyclase [Chitinivibrionales bacterium]
MRDSTIKVLLLQDNQGATQELRHVLSLVTIEAFHVECVTSTEEALQWLKEEAADVILLDLALSEIHGVAGFHDFFDQASEIPIVVLANRDDDEMAIRAIKMGAQDYLVKGKINNSLIQRAIKYAIERHRINSELRFALASEKVLMEELDRKNKELVELSITDGLTGLYNHRFIQERFDFEFKRARRYDAPLACLLMDIDHFKAVNDTHGHQFGDFVLKEIAGIIKDRSREVDICGRYGGEEFMVIANLNAAGAMQFASKLHAAIESHEYTERDVTIHCTVSIGIAEYRNDVTAKQELIERSDTALYWAKRDGRNLIRLWKEIAVEEKSDVDQFSIEGLKDEFMRLSSEMRATYMESTDALVKAIDAKDHYTQEHSKNVSDQAVLLAEGMDLDEGEVEIIRYAGLLHDIGKIGISQDVLTKREQLSEEEFAILRKHPVIGANILKDVRFLEKEIPIILHHHEHYDGSGYPHGLKGREIPVGARILAVVDAYDAMTTERGYRQRMSHQEALAELHNGSGTQFAPDAVEAFGGVVEKIRTKK